MYEKTLRKYQIGKEMFKSGETLSSIAKQLHLNRGRLSVWLRRQGIDTKEDVEVKYEEGFKLYNDGMSLTNIATELKLGRKSFTKWLKENKNIIISNPSKKYSYDDNYFKVIDTEDKAYWLGFIYADGCIVTRYSKKDMKLKNLSLEISLCKRDEQHLIKFNQCINSNKPITYKTNRLNGKNFECATVRIHSTSMCKDLINLGCVPRKSLILQFPTEDKVPPHLIKHFVRGYIDGDGWVGISTNKKCARVSICGTFKFLERMQVVMGWDDTKIRRSKTSQVHTLEYGATKTILYLQEIYDDATYYLDRKYARYKEMFAVLGGNS